MVEALLDALSSPVGGAAEDGLEGWWSSPCVSASAGCSDCVITDGEADAARSCSSRLAPVMGEDDDLTNEESAGFPGCARGRFDVKGGRCPEKGNGSDASLKRRPLQGSNVSGMERQQQHDYKN